MSLVIFMQEQHLKGLQVATDALLKGETNLAPSAGQKKPNR